MEIDQKLISAVGKMKAGDEAGFNEVYSSTYNFVYFRARQIMKNEDDAKDLVQIVYMEAFRSIGSLETPESLFSWLGAITYRQGMKLFRKKTELLLDEDFENVFENLESLDSDSRPDISAEQKEERDRIAALIEELPEAQRMTVIAYYYDNIKIDDIAEVMDCSVGTVKSRLNYARRFLKKKLEQDAKTHHTGKGAIVLSVPLIFLAIQQISTKTVLAADEAQTLYKGICGGLGLAAGAITTTAAATAAAGSAAAGTTAATAAGAGVSAATVSSSSAGIAAASATAATTAATAATAATTATTGTAVAAGTAAGGAAGTAAAGSAAVGTGTAVAAGVAGGTAAKGVAIAVAVAVAGTGAGVGSVELHRRATVSSVSAEEAVSADTVEEPLEVMPEEIMIPDDAIGEEIVSDDADPEEGLQEGTEGTVSENFGDEEIPDEPSEERTVSENDRKRKTSENSVHRFKMSKKVSKHLSSSVASLLLLSGQTSYSGNVDNTALEAAYLIGESAIVTEKEFSSLSGNTLFLRKPSVDEAHELNGTITVKGQFYMGQVNENGDHVGNWYEFELTGTENKGNKLFGGLSANSLLITAATSGEEPAENVQKDEEPSPSESASGEGSGESGSGESSDEVSKNGKQTETDPEAPVYEEDIVLNFDMAGDGLYE
ncbi:RNA polymerase sigma factor, sigma-70 family [Lachnospiraceae bacterium]|nr:RNA polymerase sigma factor, sigma-70 family [Lachnospiraceae bacterium]